MGWRVCWTSGELGVVEFSGFPEPFYLNLFFFFILVPIEFCTGLTVEFGRHGSRHYQNELVLQPGKARSEQGQYQHRH